MAPRLPEVKTRFYPWSANVKAIGEIVLEIAWTESVKFNIFTS